MTRDSGVMEAGREQWKLLLWGWLNRTKLSGVIRPGIMGTRCAALGELFPTRSLPVPSCSPSFPKRPRPPQLLLHKPPSLLPPPPREGNRKSPTALIPGSGWKAGKEALVAILLHLSAINRLPSSDLNIVISRISLVFIPF